MGHLPRKYFDIKFNGQAMSAIGTQVREVELPNSCEVEKIPSWIPDVGNGVARLGVFLT